MSALRFVLTFLAVTVVCAARAAPFQKPAKPYTFGVPAGWTAMSLGDDTIVTSGDAYVRIVKVPGGGKDDTPVSRVIGQVGEQWPKFKQDERGQANLSGSTGIYIFISGVNPKGVEATMRIVAARFGDDAYMLIMSAPTRDFLNIKEAFKQIEHSFALSSGIAPNASRSELPARSAVNGFKAVDVAGGGSILFTTLSGVSSGLETFRAGLTRIRGYFDSPPKLLSAIASRDHNLTLSVFSTALRGSQVVGIATANYDPAGNSHFAIVFDKPDHLKTSLTPMMRQVHEMVAAAIEGTRPAGSGPTINFAKFDAAASKVALTRMQYPGGIGSIGIASGYKPNLQSSGTCAAFGDDGSYMNLMGFDGMLDPRGSTYEAELQLARNTGATNFTPIPGQVIVQYDPNPVGAWKKYLSETARQRGTPALKPNVEKEGPVKGLSGGWTGTLVSGTMTINDEPFAFTGSLMTSPAASAEGFWSLSVTMLVAPVKNAAKDFPALIAMQKSVRLDMQAVRDQTNRNIAQINEQTTRWLGQNKAAGDAERDSRFASSMANAQTAREAMDKSTANFILYINDESLVRNKTTGATSTVGANYASALVKSNPNFTAVQVGQ